jgi:hypothetical protein
MAGVAVLVVGLVILVGGFIAVRWSLTAMAETAVANALARQISSFHGSMQENANKAWDVFQKQTDHLLVYNANRQDALMGFLSKLHAVELGLHPIVGDRQDPEPAMFREPNDLDRWMQAREIPAGKRNDVLMLFSMDETKAMAELSSYMRVQDLKALRLTLGALDRAMAKALPFLPAPLAARASAYRESSRSIGLDDAAVDVRSWQAARNAANRMLDELRALSSGVRHEFAHPTSHPDESER